MTSVIIDLPYISDAANFMVDGFVALGTAILLFLLSCRGKLKRSGGIIMLLCYTSYFIYLLAMQ
jgi:cation:H+ antiporter